MTYNNLITRTDLQATIPEVVSNDLLTTLTAESAAMRLFRRVPVSTNVTRMPVLSALPIAYFVQGDTGLKQTTEMAWANRYLNVEEIAAIIPIPDSVAADLTFNIWDTAKPLLSSAIARAFDAAVFFGVNKPASWPTAIVAQAITQGNTVTLGTATAGQGGVAQDVNNVLATVESEGFDVNGLVTSRIFRAKLRGARDTMGQKLLDVTTDQVEGQPVVYAMAGLWPSGAGTAAMLAGDFQQGIVGVRQDITFAMSKDGVIQDNTGAIIYNSFQQDMSLMRVTMRVAFQVANTISYQQQVEAQRYPFAVLLNA